MDALLHRWLTEDADMPLGIPPWEEADCNFDNKENIPPDSPLPDFLNWTPPSSPPPPPPPAPSPRPTIKQPLAPVPTATPISKEDRQKAAKQKHNPTPPLHIGERLRKTEDIVLRECKTVENPTWPGFTFFQLTPLAMDIFHKDPPLYKYPLRAFIEVLTYKDTKEKNNLVLPKKFGGAGSGHYRQFVETQDAGIIAFLYSKRQQMDLLAYRSTLPTACGHPMIILYDWRNQGCMYYEVFHFVMEIVSKEAPERRDYVGPLIQQSIQYMGQELPKRVFKEDVFDGHKIVPLVFGDPFAVTFFGLFVCACVGVPFQVINDTFYLFNIRNTPIWTLQYPPQNKGAM